MSDRLPLPRSAAMSSDNLTRFYRMERAWSLCDFFRPGGTGRRCFEYPPINRRAIFFRPPDWPHRVSTRAGAM